MARFWLVNNFEILKQYLYVTEDMISKYTYTNTFKTINE